MDKHAAELSVRTKAGACGYGLEMEERGHQGQGVPLGLHGQGQFLWNQGQALLVHTVVGDAFGVPCPSGTKRVFKTHEVCQIAE